MRYFWLLLLISSTALSQLSNTGLRTWARGVNPGAGALNANSDSLNGNWWKIDSLWGTDHTGDIHDNVDMYGIFRFRDDSTSKIRWRNDDTILTKSTGQHSLTTQVRDDGTRTASTSNQILVRTSDDDSTLSGMAAYGNQTTEIFGSIIAGAVVRDTNAFTTTATSDTVVISGATASDIYVLSIRLDAASTLPVAGDLLGWFAKTDTLIVNRAVGTTSGLKYSFIRIK